MLRHSLALSSTLFFLVSGSALAQPAPAESSQPLTGRFVRGAGERVAKLERAGTKRSDLGTSPYSGSYLPRKYGPLAKKNDAELRRMIREGFGECDLVHKIIKDNARKDSASKLEATGHDGFRDRYLADGFDKKAETWEGFCHNWAPAGLDPAINLMVSMDRIYMDVPFGIGDLRELTTYVLPDTWDTAWFGKRHNEKKEKEKPEDELDPVDLMTILENYVGKGKPGIVMDVDPGYMVWNQPFYEWTRTATRVTDEAQMGPKRPPRKGRAYKVKLDAKYAVEGHYGYRGETMSRDSSWEFYVYTDKHGNIVDSAWDPNAYNKIPDFAWAPRGERMDSPEFETLKRIANEGVKVSDIEEFCRVMAALDGKPSRGERKKLKKLLDKICPVLDQNRLREYIRKTAERTGIDYSILDEALASTTAAHS